MARILRLVVGLIIFGIGLGSMIAADLGLPPWDVLHQGLSEQFDQPVGRMINLVGLVVLAAMVLLREPMGLGTVLNIVIIGVVVDLFLAAVEEPGPIWLRWALMIVGPAIVAVGSGLYIGAGLGPGPRDGVMTALKARGVAVWQARFVIEAAAIAVGFLLGGTIGVGSVWFLVAIGPLVDISLRLLTIDQRLDEILTIDNI